MRGFHEVRWSNLYARPLMLSCIIQKRMLPHNFLVIYFCTSSTSGLSMKYFFIWKGPKDNLLESLSFLNSKNDRIKLTYVIDESRISFWIYFFTKMLILAHCSFLPIKSHQTNIFILFPRATRGPLLDLEASLCAILEKVPR